MKYILIHAKGEMLNLPYGQNDEWQRINLGLINTYGVENVNYFIISYDKLNTKLNVKQIIKGELKYDLINNSSIIYMKLKYPEFFKELYKLFNNDIYKECIVADTIISLNPKSIDLIYYSQFYDLRKMLKITKIDPTKQKKYFKWLCKIFIESKNEYKIFEDGEKIQKLLTDFENINVKNQIKKLGYSLDILSYPDENKLFKVISLATESDELNLGKAATLAKCLIHETDKFNVYEIFNHKDSVTICTNTFWCTAADSEESKEHFNYYTKNGEYPLIVVVNNITKQKYQLALADKVLLDYNDQDFDWFILPQDIWLLFKNKFTEYNLEMTTITRFYQNWYDNKPEYLDYTVYEDSDVSLSRKDKLIPRIVANTDLDWCNVKAGTVGGVIRNINKLKGKIWLDFDSRIVLNYDATISGENIVLKNVQVHQTFTIKNCNNILLENLDLKYLDLFWLNDCNDSSIKNIKYDYHTLDKNQLVFRKCNKLHIDKFTGPFLEVLEMVKCNDVIFNNFFLDKHSRIKYIEFKDFYNSKLINLSFTENELKSEIEAYNCSKLDIQHSTVSYKKLQDNRNFTIFNNS